jgi:hypothetical protein
VVEWRWMTADELVAELHDVEPEYLPTTLRERIERQR